MPRTDILIPSAILAVVFGTRVLLWWKFRNDRRGRWITVSTAQLVVVVAAVGAYSFINERYWFAISGLALATIIGLSFIPAAKKPHKP
jgi:hypothetical protein